MKKKILSCLGIIILTLNGVSSQETSFKVMFYNLLNYPLEDAVPNRLSDLSYILSDYQPDLFLVCELNNISGAIDILNTTQSAIDSNFEMATYVSNSSDDNYGNQNDLQNLLYYNSSKFSIEEEIIVPTSIRDFNIYRLQLKTVEQATNPVELYVIICHLKASNGAENAQKRFEMVENLEDYLDSLPADSNVILGGDLNIYQATEAAFQNLLNNNNHITFTDPLNRVGSWHNNSAYVDVFTQSTRTQNNLGGASGGLDDRFDFILVTENMFNDNNITYVPESYKAYGNNGLESCWNKAINSDDCETTNSEFSYTLRNHLHNFSDHLPVTMSLETNATFLNLNHYQISANINLEATVIKQQLVAHINSTALYNQTAIIYNNLGQKVKTIQIHSKSKQSFDVSGLYPGSYYLTIPNLYSKPLKFIIL